MVNDSKRNAQSGIGMYPDPRERIELVSTSDDKLVGNVVVADEGS